MTKKWFIFAVLLVMVAHGAFLGAADKAVPKKAIKAVKKADKALMEKNYEKALEGYNKAIQLAPEYAPAHFGKAKLLGDQGKLTESLTGLENAIKFDPASADYKKVYANVLYKLGETAMKKRDARGSNTYFEKLISIPGIADLDQGLYVYALFYSATNYYILQDFSASNKYYLQLIEVPNVDPKHRVVVLQGYYQVASTFANLRKGKEASTYFEKLLAMEDLKTALPPLYISTYYGAGRNYVQTGETKKAIEYLTKFLELSEGSAQHAQFLPEVYMYLGGLNMKLLEDEIKNIDKTVKKGKIEKVAELAKQRTDIEKFLLKAIELDANNERAHMDLGNYYYRCNDKAKAVEMYEKLVAKFPGSQDINTYKTFLKGIKEENKGGKKKK